MSKVSLIDSDRIWVLRLLCGSVALILLCIAPVNVAAQKEHNIWYFGNRVGLDFRTSPPTLLHNGMIAVVEGTASVADELGNLLFYTDGLVVYNRTHRVMPNGFGLLGHTSSSNNVIIVPDPASKQRHYVFTADYYGGGRANRGINYSVVDLALDNGRGDVTIKNVRVLDSTTEQLGAVTACGDSAFWVVGHKNNSDAWYAWKVGIDGVEEPVISHSGASIGYPFNPDLSVGMGCLAFSPKGNMLSVAHYQYVSGFSGQIFKFDPATGVVSDPIGIVENKGCYGTAFSQDGSKVFFSSHGNIISYDVTNYTSAKVRGGRRSYTYSGNEEANLTLGPDGNIYFRTEQILGRIRENDSTIALIDQKLYDLGPGNEQTIGLPTFPMIVPAQARQFKLSNVSFRSISSCEQDSSVLEITNADCEARTLLTYEVALYKGVFTLDTIGVFPLTLEPGETKTIVVRFDPNFQAKLFVDEMSLVGYEGDSSRKVRTTFPISARSIPVPPQLLSDHPSIDFGATSTCFTRDTLITITNTGCDTLTLDNVNGSGSAYSYSNVAVPMKLAPGESITVTVTFHPTTQGNHFGNLQLTATQQGITKKTDIPLSGTGAAGEGLLILNTSKDVSFSTMSICASSSDNAGRVQNTGCAAIIVKSATLTGSSDFTLLTPVNNVRLEPDSSLTFRIIFTPQDKGTRAGLVTITWTDEKSANPKDITITLGANVIDGTKVLSTEGIAAINFGETNICEERDSLVHLVNKGCDTLTITNADVDKHFAVGGSFPIVLAPGESMDVPVTTIVDTTGKPTVLTGLLNITSTADNQIAPIALTRQLYYPTKLRIEAVDEASGKAGDEVKFGMILEGDVPSTMTALKFDFLHNNDLLSWDRYDGIGLNRTNVSGNENERASFVLSPVHAGVIGELTFKTRLAIAEQTTLSFDNITFEAKGVSFAPECIAVISDTGTRFNYIYTCGDNIIRDRLNGTRLIKSITPNPAKDEIRVELNVAGSVDVSVFNALGVEVVKSACERVDVSKLPSGVYYVRVAAAGDVQTKRVVISR